MQRETVLQSRKRWTIAGLTAGAAAVIWLRSLLWQAVILLFLGMATALAALPLMRRLEKKLSCGMAATLSLTGLGAALLLGVVVLLPALLSQGRQLAAMLPGLLERGNDLLLQGENWLRQHGVGQDVALKEMLISPETLGAAAPKVAGWMGGIAGSVGQWMLAPVLAFYFLRDRRLIARRALQLLPVERRGLVIRILREMRRETAGYLRGQLMVSAIVGVLTAVGLLFCGIPAWLALGVLMGMLELIPYAGPLIGALMVAVFAAPLGLGRMLWALGVVLAVQQAEGSMLSPQLISDATRLHPAVVVLCIALGAAAAGVTGILLSVPLLLCIRAIFRVLSQEAVHDC